MESPKTVERSSRMPGFGKLSAAEQVERVAAFANLDEGDTEKLLGLATRKDTPRLEFAPNFLINGKDYVVTGVIEEASVVPAMSNGAKMVREGGGFTAAYTGSVSEGEIEIMNVRNIEGVKRRLNEAKDRICEHMAGLSGHVMVEDFALEEARYGDSSDSIVVNFTFNTGDAQGANKIDDMLEAARQEMLPIVGVDGEVMNGILSNDGSKRLVMASVAVPASAVGGRDVAERIAHWSAYAHLRRRKRGVTDDKGVMNGVMALLRSVENDTRAEDSAVRNFALDHRAYEALATWTLDNEGNLRGDLTMPAVVATKGGATALYENSRMSMKVLSRNNVKDFQSEELACVMGAVALASSLAALRAHAAEGIQQGHRRLFEWQKAQLGNPRSR